MKAGAAPLRFNLFRMLPRIAIFAALILATRAEEGHWAYLRPESPVISSEGHPIDALLTHKRKELASPAYSSTTSSLERRARVPKSQPRSATTPPP